MWFSFRGVVYFSKDVLHHIDLILFVSVRVGGFTRSGKENDLISFPTSPVSRNSRISLDCKSD